MVFYYVMQFAKGDIVVITGIKNISRNESEVLAEISNKPKMISLGINDQYSEGGTYNFLLKKYGLNVEGIVRRVSEEINKI